MISLVNFITPAVYLATAIVYAILSVLAFNLFLVCKREHQKWQWYFLGLCIESFLITLHTGYWCGAKFIEAIGMEKAYAVLSSLRYFAFAQGLEMLAGVVMLGVFIKMFYIHQNGKKD